MSAFEIVSIADIPARTARRSKTSPLRDTIKKLKPGDCFYVDYYSEEKPDGFKNSTVAQVAGRMTRESDEYRYSIRSESDRNGCHICCMLKAA